MTQAYIQAAVRLLVVMGCAGVALFALEMSKPERLADGWCDIHAAMDCFDRLGLRR